MPVFSIRPIRPEDSPRVASIIRTVMPEFGASGPGFAIHDQEVNAMAQTYSRPRHAYFVVEGPSGQLVGGGGVGPLWGGRDEVCELRKMYFLPEARGQGQGEALLRRCLQAARELGFKTVYLETLSSMTQAMKLYERMGFQKLDKPLGATGHFGCNRFYALEVGGPE